MILKDNNKELREELIAELRWETDNRLPQEYYEDLATFIASREKQLVREARIDELEALNHPHHSLMTLHKEIAERLAELKGSNDK